MVRRDLDRYRKNGPDATTRELIEALVQHAATGTRLIDIGSGIGVLSQALLEGPVAHATLVDESSSYQSAARDLAREKGMSERCTFVGDDFVRAQPDLGPADIVTLDRVVCCYPDYASLLGAVVQTGASWCGLSYPRDRWYIKPVVAMINLTRWFTRSEFRVFVHPEPGMLGVLERAGFAVRSQAGTFVWQTTVLVRNI